MEGNLHIDGSYSDKFYGYAPGERVVLRVEARLRTLGMDMVDLDVEDCEIEDDTPRDYEDAARRAKNEIYAKSHIEPSIG